MATNAAIWSDTVHRLGLEYLPTMHGSICSMPSSLRDCHRKQVRSCPACNRKCRGEVAEQRLTELREGAFLRIVELRALDDDGVRWQIDAPCQCGGGAEHLEQAVRKQALHESTIAAQHARVVDTNAAGEQLLQLPSVQAYQGSAYNRERPACLNTNTVAEVDLVRLMLNLSADKDPFPQLLHAPWQLRGQMKTDSAGLKRIKRWSPTMSYGHLVNYSWSNVSRFSRWLHSKEQGLWRRYALVTGFANVLGSQRVERAVRTVEGSGVARLLQLSHQRAPRLASVLARVHKHHGLMALAQAVYHLHAPPFPLLMTRQADCLLTCTCCVLPACCCTHKPRTAHQAPLNGFFHRP